MSQGNGEPSPRVCLAQDRTAAWLEVPADFPRPQLTRQLIHALLTEQSVELTPAVEQAIQYVVDNPPPEGEARTITMAEATEPVHGRDGLIEWQVQEPEQQSTDLSFYERTAFVMVEADQVVGQRYEATEGEDGRDVTGRARGAKTGKPVPWTLDESLTVTDDGAVVARKDGMLVRADARAYVTDVLEVKENVDFSTGNIDFNGSVIVSQNVRDRFEVKATGSVDVHGLIEAAFIECDGDLLVHGGIAGREQGHVSVGAQLTARYLNGARGYVTGDVCVQKEIFNSELEISGALNAENSPIMGGQLTIGGPADIGSLGSDGGAATTLVLGRVPRLEHMLTQLEGLMEQYQQRVDHLRQQQQQLNQRPSLGANNRERQTELMSELNQAEQTLSRAQTVRNQLHTKATRNPTVRLHVNSMLYAGVWLYIHGQRFVFNDDHRGPVRITLNAQGQPQFQQGKGRSCPLETIAATRVAAA